MGLLSHRFPLVQHNHPLYFNLIISNTLIKKYQRINPFGPWLPLGTTQSLPILWLDLFSVLISSYWSYQKQFPYTLATGLKKISYLLQQNGWKVEPINFRFPVMTNDSLTFKPVYCTRLVTEYHSARELWDC